MNSHIQTLDTPSSSLVVTTGPPATGAYGSVRPRSDGRSSNGEVASTGASLPALGDTFCSSCATALYAALRASSREAVFTASTSNSTHTSSFVPCSVSAAREEARMSRAMVHRALSSFFVGYVVPTMLTGQTYINCVCVCG